MKKHWSEQNNLIMKKNFTSKKLFILFAGICLTSLCFSQDNYLPGFVIRNNGDTLKGFIDYRNWRVNPKEINFKSTIDSNPTSFIPINIKEFSVKDEVYSSGIVEVEISPVEESRLDYDPNQKIRTDTIFLQTLFRGNKCLYYYMNSNGRENFYISNKNSEPELLIYKKYLVKQGTTSLVRTRNDYIGQLKFFFSDNPKIQSKIENASYSKKDMIRLFQEYYKNTSSEIGFKREAEKVHLEIGTMAGLSMTKLKFNSSDPAFDYLENTDFKLSTNFTGGLLFDLIIPRNRGKFSINNELLFSMYKTSGQYEYLDINDTHKKLTSEFNYSYLKINNLLRYRFLFKNISVFLNGGISSGIRIGEKMHVKKEFTTSWSGTTVYEGSPFIQTEKFELGFIAGAGVKFKNISLEARMEKGDGMINVPSINAWATRYNLFVSYRFK